MPGGPVTTFFRSIRSTLDFDFADDNEGKFLLLQVIGYFWYSDVCYFSDNFRLMMVNSMHMTGSFFSFLFLKNNLNILLKGISGEIYVLY